MKIMGQMAVIGALIGLGTVGANAQTTNITVNVNITLSGVVQVGDSATKGRITTTDVIQAVQPGASTKAKLSLQFTPGSLDSVFVVQDAGTVTVIDSGVLSASVVGDSVVVVTVKNNLIVEKIAEIRRFVLNTDTLSFDVQGYTTSSADNKSTQGVTFDTVAISSASGKVSGTVVDSAGNHGVAQGTVGASKRKITVEPAAP